MNMFQEYESPSADVTFIMIYCLKLEPWIFISVLMYLIKLNYLLLTFWFHKKIYGQLTTFPFSNLIDIIFYCLFME